MVTIQELCASLFITFLLNVLVLKLRSVCVVFSSKNIYLCCVLPSYHTTLCYTI